MLASNGDTCEEPRQLVSIHPETALSATILVEIRKDIDGLVSEIE